MISKFYLSKKAFFMEKKNGPKFAGFQGKKKFPNRHIFMISFQEVAKNIEVSFFLFFFKTQLSYVAYSQIGLKYFMDDRHFGYIIKSLF